MKTFTQDWFTRNISSWQKHLKHLKGKKHARFLEIGVFEGMSTCWLLENIATDDSARIDVFDTFEGSMESEAHKANLTNLLERFKANTQKYSNKINIVIGKSQQTLRDAGNEFNDFYDFIYIDGSHKASDVLQDIMLSWPSLKKGGIFIMDDYDWKFYDDYRMLPKPAIDTFLDLYYGEFVLLNLDAQAIVKKI